MFCIPRTDSNLIKDVPKLFKIIKHINACRLTLVAYFVEVNVIWNGITFKDPYRFHYVFTLIDLNVFFTLLVY